MIRTALGILNTRTGANRLPEADILPCRQSFSRSRWSSRGDAWPSSRAVKAAFKQADPAIRGTWRAGRYEITPEEAATIIGAR
jgi:hypothetical protein